MRVRRLGQVARATSITAALVVAAGCSSSDSGGICSSAGSCPNATPPTSSEVAQCNNLAGDAKCGGVFQMYFNCASAQERCTTQGVTDDAATKSAIEANCATEVAAYKSCTSGTTMSKTCGFSGAACCTDGSPPCASTNCCDPATNKCHGAGEACIADGTVCAAGQCTSCGAPGQPCCTIIGMTQPDGCPRGGCCDYAHGESGGTCHPEGGQCDAPGPNTTETVCRNKSCITCGGFGGYCCADNKCTEAGTTCNTSAMCVPP